MLDLSAAFDTVSHAGGRGRLYCFPITFIDPFRVPVWLHIATGERFASLLQINVGRHRGENIRDQERQNARLISLIVSVRALLLLLSVLQTSRAFCVRNCVIFPLCAGVCLTGPPSFLWDQSDHHRSVTFFIQITQRIAFRIGGFIHWLHSFKIEFA